MDTNTIIIISTNIAMVVALFIGIMNSNANLSNKIDAVKDELHNFKLEVKDELTNLKVEVANVKVEVAKQNANFGIVEERNTASTKKLTEQLASIKEQVSATNEQLVITKEQVIATNQRTDKLEAEVKDAKFEFRNITKELIKVFPKFSTNEVAKEPQLAV